jgi:hypothetical protein
MENEVENEIDECTLCKNPVFMRLFRFAYCAKRTKVHMEVLSEANEIHKVLDGGPFSALFEPAKTITRFIQRFGTRVN